MARTALVKIKPRRYKVGDIVTVASIIMHPMHTGLQKDKKTGKVIPAQYIQKIEVFYGDEKVTWMDVFPSVSANPYIAFNLKITKAAPLKIIWTENDGTKTEKTIQIKPKG